MRKFMPKTLTIILLALLAMVSLAACGDDSAVNGGGQSSGGGEVKAEAFVFTAGGTDILMNAEAAPIVGKLGEAISYFEAESCAFQGTDRIYTYDGFQLNTYPLNDVDYVSSVFFTSDAVSTPEGLEIGSSKEDMLAAYGEEYTEEYDQYTYNKGDSRLVFLLEDGAVTSIEYQAVLPQ